MMYKITFNIINTLNFDCLILYLLENWVLAQKLVSFLAGVFKNVNIWVPKDFVMNVSLN